MLVNFNDILATARREYSAVGSFNGYNYETFQGIISAGQEERQPVILAFGEKYLRNMPLHTAFVLADSLASQTEMPVCLHLDHCSDMTTVFQAIHEGFNSVMYDGSALRFEDNVKNTKAVCRVAQACGVSVEAELGSLAAGKCSHEGSSDDCAVYTDPKAAREFVAATEVNALAVSIGTVHGLYQGRPKLRLDILKAICAQTDVPLVLHGGSGLTEAEVSSCIRAGIAKINVNTEISVYAIRKTTELLAKEQLHFSELSLNQSGYVKEIVKKYMAFFSRK